MAQAINKNRYTIFTLLVFSILVEAQSLGFKKQKASHLHFYFHDVVGGSHPTTARVAQANITSTSPTSFGAMVMIDDKLTIGPEPTSKIVGRAQGMYAFACLSETRLLMALNYVFLPVREMPIVGGTGLFRLARGYALAKTRLFDDEVAIVEYDVYVLHY